MMAGYRISISISIIGIIVSAGNLIGTDSQTQPATQIMQPVQGKLAVQTMPIVDVNADDLTLDELAALQQLADEVGIHAGQIKAGDAFGQLRVLWRLIKKLENSSHTMCSRICAVDSKIDIICRALDI